MANETKAQEAGRNDARDWIAESEPSEWLTFVGPASLPADEALINALGWTKAGRVLGVEADGAKPSSEALEAFGQYAAAYRAEVEAAIVNAKRNGVL